MATKSSTLFTVGTLLRHAQDAGTPVRVLAGLGAPGMKLVALVEEAAARPHLHAIAAAHPRLVALGVGGEDLATGLGAEATADALDLPKRMGVLAARAAERG